MVIPTTHHFVVNGSWLHPVGSAYVYPYHVKITYFIYNKHKHCKNSQIDNK